MRNRARTFLSVMTVLVLIGSLGSFCSGQVADEEREEPKSAPAQAPAVSPAAPAASAPAADAARKPILKSTSKRIATLRLRPAVVKSPSLFKTLWSALWASDTKKAEEEARRKAAVEQAQSAYEKEQRELRDRLSKDPLWQPSHEQASVIKVSEHVGNRAVHSFCLDGDGNLLVCCGANAPQRGGGKPDDAEKATAPGVILVLSSDGKKVGEWKMEFEPQAICRASDGTVYVGGAGKVAKLDAEGKVLLVADAPNVAELPPLPPPPEETPEPRGEEAQAAEKAKQEKIAKLREEVAKAMKEYQEIAQEARKNLKPDDSAAMEAYRNKIEKPLEKYRTLQQELTDLQTTPEMRAQRLRKERERQLTLAGMAVTDRDVFVSCRSSQGYGFEAWRTDRDFKEPKKVATKLAGCCGQMDVQARDGELWVGHNGRHKVEHFDRDGKQLSSFGRRDRVAADGFGGCCEPKNLRFAPNGELFAAESGPPTCVKRFTPDGKFLGMAVVAPWQSGCVRVTTEYKADADQFFVLNSGERTIHVFAKKKPAAPAAPAEPPAEEAK
ncbi:MAG: hypothetical protein JW809_03850 [Pirellulales bacterium]|nr:hypothetical protein [Pirellulales bacterium]